MAIITTREIGATAKGTTLSNAEIDNNFINLNSDIATRISSTEKGAANGVATLDVSGLIPTTQLPSYVDDVLEADNLASFPLIGETGKIYVALDTNKTYRWSGSAYIFITSGAVDSVAGKTGVVTLDKTDVGLGNVDNTSDATKNSATTTLTNKTINLADNTLQATSAQLAAAVTDETGTGALVFANSPTFVTPALGTPASGVVTNLTGTASININGTVGATTASTGAFTTLSYNSTLTGGTGVVNLGSGQFYKDASGNVGIGTSSPGRIFHIDGGTVNNTYARFTNTNGGNTAEVGLFQSGATGGHLVNSISGATGFIQWSTNGTERMRLDSSGNVGIGTSTVRGDLNIYRSAANFSNDQDGSYGSLFIQGGNQVSLGSFHGAISFGKGSAGREQFKYGAIALVQTTADADQHGLAFFVSPNADQTTPGTISEAMRITSAGNVGIGTTSPSIRLQVSGPEAELYGTGPSVYSGFQPIGTDSSIAATATSGNRGAKASLQTFTISDGTNSDMVYMGVVSGLSAGSTSSSPTFGNLVFGRRTGNTAWSETMRITSAGNVGIGTTAPDDILNVFSGGTGGEGVHINNFLPQLKLTDRSGGGTVAVIQQDSLSMIVGPITGSTRLVLQTSNTERMRITSTGNVGIGTSSPTQLLQISGGAVDGRMSFTNNARGNSATDGLWVGVDSAQSYILSRGDFPLSFYTNATEKMRITSAGNVGIGTSSPTAVGSRTTVNVAGTAGAALRLSDDTANMFLDYTDGTGGRLSVNAAEPLLLQTSSLERMRITSAGNVGIGTSSPSAVLHAVSSTNTPAVFTGTSAGGQVNVDITNTNAGNASSKAALRFFLGGTSTAAIVNSNNSGPSPSLEFFVSGSERMRITSAGNVGIGTSSPAASFVVAGSNATVYKAMILRNGNGSDGSSATIDFETSAGIQGSEATMAGRIAGLRIGSGTSGALTFSTTNAGVLGERARIDSSGNLIQTVNTTAATLATNNTLTFSIVGNSTLRISVRGSDGTTRTATVALT